MDVKKKNDAEADKKIVYKAAIQRIKGSYTLAVFLAWGRGQRPLHTRKWREDFFFPKKKEKEVGAAGQSLY